MDTTTRRRLCEAGGTGPSAVDEAPVATASELVLKFLGEQVEMKIKKLRARGAR